MNTGTTGQSTTGPHCPTCPGSGLTAAAALAASEELAALVWLLSCRSCVGERITESSSLWAGTVLTDGWCAGAAAGATAAAASTVIEASMEAKERGAICQGDRSVIESRAAPTARHDYMRDAPGRKGWLLIWPAPGRARPRLKPPGMEVDA